MRTRDRDETSTPRQELIKNLRERTDDIVKALTGSTEITGDEVRDKARRWINQGKFGDREEIMEIAREGGIRRILLEAFPDDDYIPGDGPITLDTDPPCVAPAKAD